MDAYLDDVRMGFRKYKKMAEKAMEPVTDEEFFRRLDPESNSIAIIVKHIAGNMRSRWRDFLTSDGEKPDRERDLEFEEAPGETRADILAKWEEGWRLLFAATDPLVGADLGRTVRIRGEEHSVLEAINRQLTHYAAHIGQIVFLGKHLSGPRWKSLSIPRGKSKEFDVSKSGQPYKTPS
jgi:hypothetical protein